MYLASQSNTSIVHYQLVPIYTNVAYHRHRIVPSVFSQNHSYIACCQTYLTQDHFAWRHHYILKFIALTLQPNCTLLADAPGFITPSVITGNSLRPDLALQFQNKCLYVVGFESNLANNANRKRLKHLELVNRLIGNYRLVEFIILSLSSIGLLDKSSDFIDMMKDLEMSSD